jgi:hypothetical protein
MPVIKIWIAILTCVLLSVYTSAEPAPQSRKSQMVKSVKGTALPKPRDQPAFGAAAVPVLCTNLHITATKFIQTPVHSVNRSYTVFKYPTYSPGSWHIHSRNKPALRQA